MNAVAEDMDCTSTSSETNKETSEASDCETVVESNETELNATGIERPVVDKTDSHLVQIKASNSEILRRISAFIDQKRNEVDENNRQEFCGVFPSMEVSEDSCARTEAIFVPRAGGKSHIKVTRVVNSYGPQTRALGSGQEQSPSKPVVKEQVGPGGVEERLNNIETHLKMKGQGIVKEFGVKITYEVFVSILTGDYSKMKEFAPREICGVISLIIREEHGIQCMPCSSQIIGQSKADVFSRLKVLEERVLFLESLSPEYFKSGPPPPKRQRSDGTAGTSTRQSLKEMTVSEIEDKMKALRETLLKKADTG